MKCKIRRVKEITNQNLIKEFHQYRVEEVTEIWIVLNEKSEEIGFCAGQRLKSGIYWIGPSFLFENARGNGLQRRLIKVREKFAKKNGYKVVQTAVDYNNYASFINLLKEKWRFIPRTNHFEVRLEKRLK